FQAEDGIRDYKVTGVQTCALPIFIGEGSGRASEGRPLPIGNRSRRQPRGLAPWRAARSWAMSCSRHGSPPRICPRQPGGGFDARSEERRVGKECRWREWAGREKKK